MAMKLSVEMSSSTFRYSLNAIVHDTLIVEVYIDLAYTQQIITLSNIGGKRDSKI